MAWAVSAKNALHTCYGYSPNQFAFGKNPNFPSNLTNKSPVMEDLNRIQLVLEHLNAIHAARKAFIEEEWNEKPHRPLKSKARVRKGLVYDLSDLVYYKVKDSDKWKWPGKVIRKKNLVKHRGCYVCVHPCSLPLISKEEGTNLLEKEENLEIADSNENQPEEKGSLDHKISYDDSDNDFSPTKISRVTEDSIIDRNNDDIEGIASSLNDLSIQSPGNLDLTRLLQSSDEPDNPTV